MNHILSKITYYAKNPSDYTFCYILLVKIYFLESLIIISRKIINFTIWKRYRWSKLYKRKGCYLLLWMYSIMHLCYDSYTLSLLLRSHDSHTWYFLKEWKILLFIQYSVLLISLYMFYICCLISKNKFAILDCQYIPMYNVHIRYFLMVSCCS